MEQVCTKNFCYLIKFTQKFCVIHILVMNSYIHIFVMYLIYGAERGLVIY